MSDADFNRTVNNMRTHIDIREQVQRRFKTLKDRVCRGLNLASAAGLVVFFYK